MNSSMKSVFLIALMAVMTLPAAARSDDSAPERAQTNRDIRVQPSEKTGDLSCFNCSIHVRGQVAGDVFAMHGNVIVEPDGQITGDVASLLGDIQVENKAQIGGDVAAIGGRIRRDPQAIIRGDQASFARLWILVMAAVPLILLGLIVALIVWLVQRRGQPVPRAA